MSSFLQHIVNNIALEPQNLRELKDHCYVFPTKRAGRFFEKALTKRFKGRFLWAPHIFSIEQFTAFLSEKVVLDAVRLVFELFVVYKKEEPTAKFDNFYTWGQIILKDFDEIDKYLVDAEALFSNLKDIKQIDEMFEIPTTELAFLKQFWRVLDKEKNTDIEEEFIRIWEVLGKVYTNFKQQLAEQGAAYDGMAQRELAENLKAGTQKIPFKHIVFAGFNALGRAEEVILTELTSQYNTTVYWDTDVYYMKDKKQEAGKFIRQYYEKWKDNDAHNWISQTNFLGLKTEDNEASLNDSVTKKWHIIGLPLKVGQAKYVGQLLQQDVANKQFSSKDTAIVLGDEGLLFPVLYSLPEEIPAINITMGYPLKDSPLYQLLETIVQLHKTRQESEKLDENTGKPYTQITFYSKFILEILHNPFIKQFAKEEVEKYMHSIERNNLLFIYPETILKHVTHPIFKIIFKKTDHFLGLINGFNDLLVALFTHIKKQHGKETAVDEADLNRKVGEVGVAEEEGEEKKENLELEFIYHMLLNLKKLEEIVRKYRQRLTIDTFWKVFRELIQSAKLPFTGTSVTGLQIMGFLETRTLDFKKLYLMALNEGTIPATKPNNTFVPFNLRKAHNMPTFLDQDAIYGYHFYHLLQRAEEVYLLYNTETNKFSTGERSRFLLQIEEEIANLPDIKVEISHHIITPPLQNDYTIAKRLEIPKNEANFCLIEPFH